MKVMLTGTVVELDRNDWQMNGKTGTSFSVMVRGDGDSQAAAATRVRVAPEQFGAFNEGDRFEAPVNVFANTIERQGVVSGAKLSVTLVPEFVPAKHKREPQPA